MMRIFKILFFSVFVCGAYAQKTYEAATVAFYNVENLFDTVKSIDYIDGTLLPKDLGFHVSIPAESQLAKTTPPYKGYYSDEVFVRKKIKALRPQIQSGDFTPEGPKRWDKDRYDLKLKRLARVISEIGVNIAQSPPVVVGLVEVENRKVLEDLVRQPALQAYDYGLIHRNSYDNRGIDCALIYRKSRFVPKDFQTYEVKIYEEKTGYRDYTRDILLVEGQLDGEDIYFIVNHWPSRRGGETASAPKRQKAAQVLKHAVGKIQSDDPDAKIIILGDFNDEPASPSIKTVLEPRYTRRGLQSGDVYNPMERICRKGTGTYAYRKQWNCFDQIMATSSVARTKKEGCPSYCLYKAGIFKKPYLIVREGAYKGYPFKTFDGKRYMGGYSDHLPIYAILIRKKEMREEIMKGK